MVGHVLRSRQRLRGKILTLSMMIVMEIDEDEKTIVAALRSSPTMKACILEMLDITDGDAFEELNNGDDAEEAVVDAIQKTGKTLLQSWAEKKNARAKEEIMADKSYRAHKKKAQMANLRRQNRD